MNSDSSIYTAAAFFIHITSRSIFSLTLPKCPPRRALLYHGETVSFNRFNPSLSSSLLFRDPPNYPLQISLIFLCLDRCSFFIFCSSVLLEGRLALLSLSLFLSCGRELRGIVLDFEWCDEILCGFYPTFRGLLSGPCYFSVIESKV